MYLELFSHLLIRKQPLGTWILFINVFSVVFTLVDKKTTSCDLDTINQCIRVVFTLVDKKIILLGPGSYLSMYLELFSHLLIRKQPLGTWILFINVFRVVFSLVDKEKTSCDMIHITQCIQSCFLSC